MLEKVILEISAYFSDLRVVNFDFYDVNLCMFRLRQPRLL